MMQLLRDEHATLSAFLAEQDARLRAAAAVESEPEPDRQIASADAEEGPVAAPASKRLPGKRVHLAKLSAAPPLSILPPPAPAAEPPRFAHVYGWVHQAYRLPRRLLAAAGELIQDREPPIPPRPIPHAG